MGLVAILVFIDFAILTIWEIFDPLIIVTKNLIHQQQVHVDVHAQVLHNS